MRIAAWEPFREGEEFFRRFGLGRPFGPWPSVTVKGDRNVEWAPMVDISETDKEFLVKAEIAGIKPEDIKVSLQEGVLSIEGERKFEQDTESEKQHRTERYYGRFCRQFALPETADAASIRAEGKDGLLKVHVPKVPVKVAPSPRLIKVE